MFQISDHVSIYFSLVRSPWMYCALLTVLGLWPRYEQNLAHFTFLVVVSVFYMFRVGVGERLEAFPSQIGIGKCIANI